MEEVWKKEEERNVKKSGKDGRRIKDKRRKGFK